MNGISFTAKFIKGQFLYHAYYENFLEFQFDEIISIYRFFVNKK